MPLNLLVVASETPQQRDARRAHVGEASNETYAETLRKIDPDCRIEHVSCVEAPEPKSEEELTRFNGIFFAGSPIQMHEDTQETRLAARFMNRVYASGTPSFGSCAGLQIAAVAAGGTCKKRDGRMEAGFARGIVATPEGRTHPMMRGRPLAWDAPALHSSIIDRLPPGAVVLAQAKGTPVEAMEIRSGQGVFWGVQYHPEISIAEIAASLRRQSDDLVEQGFAADEAALDRHAETLELLDAHPERRDIAWQLGLDEEVLDERLRTREVRNFFRFLTGRTK